MRVALINPKGTIFSKNPRLAAFLEQSVTMGSFRHFWSAPCLGLLTIAAYIPSTWQIDYIDENQTPIDWNRRYDLVCISAMTVQAVRAYAIADQYRSCKTTVVMGGIHATVMPEEAALHADVVLAGEGEALFPAFLKDLMHGQLQRIYRQEHPGGFDLSECITPRYDLLAGINYPLINLYTTRGCPRKCTFCCASNVFGTSYRRKTNEQILREITVITRLFPDKPLLFADDNAFVMRKQSKELLRQMIPLGLRWIAQVDILAADDDELLSLMTQAGCQWVVIGFESVSAQSLEGIEGSSFKGMHLRHYKESIEAVASHGIGVYGTFIVGLDGDGPRVFDETAEFILQNRLYGANITVPTPLPGTVLRQKLLGKQQVLDFGWDYYTLWDVVSVSATLDRQELEDGLYRVYQRITHANHADARLIDLMHRQRQMRTKNEVTAEKGEKNAR